MEFLIRKAGQRDLAAIMRVMEEVVATMGNPAWFAPLDEAFVAAQLQGEGFVLAAETAEGEMAAIFEAHFPDQDSDNLGLDAGLWQAELPKVVHMDLAAVRPLFRGHGLQTRLMAAGEAETVNLGYRHLLCTVHPDNRYSLSNLLGLGYGITVTLPKYGGLPRHVLYKSNGPALAGLRYPGLDDFLLSLPGAQKDYKAAWGWLRYQVGGKLFAALCTPGLQHGAHGGRTMLILKGDPLLAELYRSQYPGLVVPGFYSDKRNWNSVYLDGDLGQGLVWDMCRHAHSQTLAKLPKKVRLEILG